RCIFRQKLLFQKAKRSDSFFYPLCGKHFSTTHFQQGVLNSYKKTLQRLQGQKLDKHTMFFAAPTETMSGLLPLVRKAGINLHKDVMKFNAHDWSKPINRLDPRIKREISAFGESHKNSADEFGQRVWADVQAAAAWGLFSSALPTMGVKASLLVGLPGRLQATRNMFANHANDPTLNPHMHPFKTTESMNAHISKNNGGEARSFIQLTKSLSREWARC
ncbi:MAG: hypothetical protein ACR2PX_20655, partial [Endozoicomonas sp.]|uniref:hypothetical protein n=1 Tax=Endozoicomonas sp. TaxID=1892382 RepID=UPI003D9BB3FE